MNNKGFTLVELLAVILILTGISLVAVSAISVSLGKRDKRECDEQIELAKNAAKIYFALHSDVTASSGVQVSVLINEGYFNEDRKVGRLNPNVYVKIVNNAYVYDGQCIN